MSSGRLAVDTYQSEAWLRKMYIDNNLSTLALADIALCSPRTIRSWMSKFGIQTRSVSDALKLFYKNHTSCKKHKPLSGSTKSKISASVIKYYKDNPDTLLRDPMSESTKRKLRRYPKLWNGEWLHEQYWGKHLSTIQIASDLGCNCKTVRNAMVARDIPRRRLSEAAKNSWKSTPLRNGGFPKGVPRSAETRVAISRSLKGRPSPMLGKKHSGNTREKISIAVRRFFDDNPSVRAKLSHKGSSNPAWRGGVSFLPYSPDFCNNLRSNIRSRDKERCHICGLTQLQSIKMFHRKLSVHHINHNKMDCDRLNLVSLCAPCHGKIGNKHRNVWEVILKNEVARDYGCN